MNANLIGDAAYVLLLFGGFLAILCIGGAIMELLDRIPVTHRLLDRFFSTLPMMDDEEDWI